MFRRRITAGLLALLAMFQLMTLTTAFAADVQIYSMTTDGGGNTINNSTFRAQSFWTGASQVTLSTVNVRIRNEVGDRSFNVSLHSSSDGKPGSKIEDLATNVNIKQWEEFNDAYRSSRILDANTQYFIVVSGNQGSSGPVWKFHPNVPTSTLSPPPTFTSFDSFDAGSTWSATTNQNYNMIVAVASF